MSVDVVHAAVSRFIIVSQLAATPYPLEIPAPISGNLYSKLVSRQEPVGPFQFPQLSV